MTTAPRVRSMDGPRGDESPYGLGRYEVDRREEFAPKFIRVLLAAGWGPRMTSRFKKGGFALRI